MSGKTLIAFDYAIKYLLRDKGEYEIVEGFISALLATAGYGPVKIKALLESESNREKAKLKKSIADVVVEDENGTKYIVEIERQSTETFVHKACFNSSRLIVDSISSSEDFATIKKIFHISLLYFTWSKNQGVLYHGKTVVREVDNKDEHSLHFIDEGGKFIDASHIFPEYFFISVPMFDDIIRRELDEWLYVMKNSEVKESFKSPYMKKVATRLSMLTMTDEEKDKYFRIRKEWLQERDALAAATIKGEAKGREEGEAKGREEGEAKGREEGEAKAKLVIAKQMLDEGISVTIVAKVTSLPVNEIEKLKQ